jgi:hypothetical protein
MYKNIVLLSQLGPPYGGVTNSAKQTTDYIVEKITQTEVIDITKMNILKALILASYKIMFSKSVFFQIGNVKRTFGKREKLLLIFAKLLNKKLFVRFFAGNNESLYLKYYERYINLIDVLYVETRDDYEYFKKIKNNKLVYQIRNTRNTIYTSNIINYDSKNYKKKLNKGVYAGAINKYKGIDVLAKIKLQGTSIDLFGQESNEWNDTCSVFYKGFLTPENVHTTLENYKYSILITSWPTEGHSGFLIESILCGCIPIATKYSGSLEILGLDYPFYIEKNSKKEVENKIKELMGLNDITLNKILNDLKDKIKLFDFEKEHKELVNVITKTIK